MEGIVFLVTQINVKKFYYLCVFLPHTQYHKRLMQLLYIWIDNYRNIKEQGFSFSSEFLFEYDPEKKVLTITDNPNYISNFFGEDIVEVTGIVGKNGSGKSSVLKQYLFSHAYNGIFMYFYIYAHEGKLLAKTSEMSIQNNPDNITQFEILDEETEKKRPFPIYYSPFLDFDHPVDNTSSCYSDLSLSYLIQHEQKQGATQFEEYRNQSLRKWIEYSNIKKDSFIDNRSLFIEINEALNIDHSEIKSEYWKLHTTDDPNNDFFHSKNSYLLNDLLDSETDRKLRLKILFLRRILQQFFHYLSGMHQHDIQISDTFLATEIPSTVAEHIEYIKEFFREQNWISEKDIFTKYIEFIFECIDDASQYRVNGNDGFSTVNDRAIELLDFDYRLVSIYEESLSIGTTVNSNFLIAIEPIGISSGEKAMIQLFSCIYSVSKENKIPQEKSICLLIDEGEIGFHPQWQKQYMNLLILTLPKIFKGKKIQIILTSHSPFILSDLPKENVIFLDTYKEENPEVKNNTQSIGNCKVVEGIKKYQTFGQNIHTLLSDGFFLEDGLMGDFAKGKIDKVIKRLNDFKSKKDKKKEFKISKKDKEELDTIKKVIEMIGEGILKMKLEQMYLDILDDDKAKITFYEQKIANLKKRNSDAEN